MLDPEPKTAREVCKRLVVALNSLRYSGKGKKEVKLNTCNVQEPVDVQGGGVRYGITARLTVPSSIMEGPVRKGITKSISDSFRTQIVGMEEFSVPDEFAQLVDHDKTFRIEVSVLTPVDWIPEEAMEKNQSEERRDVQDSI